MRKPTTYQALVIEERGYDPETWFVIDWQADRAIIGNRTRRGETAELKGIIGYPDDEVCRNLAGDEEDSQHDYRPLAQGPYGYQPEEES